MTRLEAKMLEKGMSASDVGHAAGFRPYYVRKIMRDGVTQQLTARKCAAALGCRFQDLLEHNVGLDDFEFDDISVKALLRVLSGVREFRYATNC